jgi:hypothetical protein
MLVKMGCGDLPVAWNAHHGQAPSPDAFRRSGFTTLKVIVEDGSTALIELMRGFLSVKKMTGGRRNEICQ